MGNSNSNGETSSKSANHSTTKNPAAEGGTETRRRSSSAAQMVNGSERRSSFSNADFSFYTTPEEREHIKTLYALLWPKEKDYLDEAFLLTLLTSYHVPVFFANTLKSVFATGKFKSSQESFEEFLVQCSRTSSTATLSVIWKLTKSMPVNETACDWTSRLIRFCALLLILSAGKDAESEAELHDAATELAGFYTQIVHRSDSNVDCNADFATLQNAVHLYSPQAARPFQAMIATIFFHADESPSFHPYLPPQCSTNSTLLTTFAAGFLAMAGEPLQGVWKCLYTMATDGISFNRIVHHVLGYDGPTVILIKTTHRTAHNEASKPIIFGVFCHERWRESNRFYGSAKNFLFTLSPRFRIYHSARQTDNHFQFLATSGFNLPHGLGFGGNLEGFRLFLPDTLEQCTVRGMCPTYEPGKLVFSDDVDVNNVQFEIEHLEVWGSGGVAMIQNALKAQADHRVVLAETIVKARKVDKAQFFNNGFDREFLLGKTFAHHKDMQERVEEEYVVSPSANIVSTITAPTAASGDDNKATVTTAQVEEGPK